MKTSRIILALLPLAFAGPAMAQGTPEQRAACGPDAFRLCAATIPNVGRTAACLRGHREQLSAACRTVMETNDGGSSKVAAAPPPAKAARPAARVAERARATPRLAERAPPDRAARPAPRVAERAEPVRQRVVARSSTVPRAAGRAGATRVVTRTVYVYVPTPRRAASRAAIRQAALRRPYYGRRGGGSEMAQAMYWMRTVSSYAGAVGRGDTIGSIGGLGGL